MKVPTVLPENTLSNASKSFREKNPHIYKQLGDKPESPGLTSVVSNINPRRKAKEPNKTETEFGMHLYLQCKQQPRFEAVKLRIGDNCYYTPDWMVPRDGEKPIFYEVKGGHVWDDSIVKFKAAVEIHGSWADFQLHQKKKGSWTRLL